MGFSLVCVGIAPALMLLVPVSQIQAAACTFSTTEATNSFNIAANWSCGQVPLRGDTVTIPASTTTNMLAGPIKVSAITVAGTLNIGSQLLTATSTFTVNSGGVATSTTGTLTVSAGAAVTSTGSIGTNSGNFLFSGNVQNNGIFDIGAGNVTTTLNSTFTNAGTINGGTGVLALAKTLVDSGGTFNAQNGTVRTFDDGHLWVANSNGSFNNVSKIDPTTAEVVATTTVGTFPIGAAFGGGYVWIGNFSSNSVSKIDPATNEVVATTTVGTGPRGMASDGTNMWVANNTTANVSKINMSTNAVVATVPVGSGPRGVAFDGSHIWVVNSSSGNVSKIDITTNAVVATTTVGTGPQMIAYASGHMWVVNISTVNVSKIDITTNLVVATTTIGTGSSPFGVVFDGTNIWVSNSGNFVSKIDITTNAVVATSTLVSGGSQPNIAFDGNHLWFVGQDIGKARKFDRTTQTVVATTTVGTSPREIVYSGTTDPISIALPGYLYRNVQVFNSHPDTVSFAASSTILGTLELSGVGKLSASTFTVGVLGAATVGSGTTVTSTSGGFNFSSAVTSTGSIGSNSGNMLFSSTLQNNGTLEIGSGTVTSTGALTNAAGATIKGETGTLSLAGDFLNSGTFTPDSGTVRIAGTAAQILAGSLFNNFGSIKTAETATFNSSSTILGTLSVTASGGTLSSATNTLTIVGASTMSGGTVTSTSGALNFGGAVSSTGAIGSSSGSQVFSSTFQNNGTFHVGSGNATTTSTFTNAAGATITIGNSVLTAVGLITNAGTITVGASGSIVHTAESIALTDSSGGAVSSYTQGNNIYVTIQDSNRNLLGGSVETMIVTLTGNASSGGDVEYLTLTETSASSGIFRNTSGLVLAATVPTANNGTFEARQSGTVVGGYVDIQDAADTGSDSKSFTVTTVEGTPTGGGGGGGSSIVSPSATTPPAVVLVYPPGTLFKLPSDGNVSTQQDSAVYYYGKDGKRHAFPNAKAYFTWYDSFSQVQILSLTLMAQIPLGMNVTYRPGVKLVKFQTLNNVYAVSLGSELRWIKTESAARDLYGSNWNTKVDDISDAFYVDYHFGAEVSSASDYSPSAQTAAAANIDTNMGL